VQQLCVHELARTRACIIPAACWPTVLMMQKSLCDELALRRIKAVIPPNPTRKHPHRYDKTAYKGRNVIERMFCRLKDFRRIATPCDKRADSFLSTVMLAAALTWWT
jgi:transposase